MSSDRPSIPFDRIADRYDETRGGLRRGRQFAGSVASFLDAHSTVADFGVGTGLVAVATGDDDRNVSPNEQADRIEGRIASMFWDLDPVDWDAIVQPGVDALRALPDPDEVRRCTQSHLLSVYQRDE